MSITLDMGKISLLKDEEEFESYLQKEAQRFEQRLTQEIDDALQRALKRREFYNKQREARMERKRALGSLAKKRRDLNDGVGSGVGRKIKNRVFEIGLPSAYNTNAYSQSDIIEYHGTLLNERIEKEQKNMEKWFLEQQRQSKETQQGKVDQKNMPGEAVFLADDGTLYDLHYRPIYVDPNALRDRRGRLSNVMDRPPPNPQQETRQQRYHRKYEFVHDPELYQSPPIPESFDSFEEYEEALLHWSKDIQNSLGYLQLPWIMGRHYYRPYVLSSNETPQHTRQISTSKSDQKQGSTSPSETATEKGNMLELVDHTNAIPEETWESHLIPLEPKPEFYDTFEEYETALIRWSVVCLGLSFVPPHPAQFQKILGIKLARKPSYPVPDVDYDITPQTAEQQQRELLKQEKEKTSKAKKESSVATLPSGKVHQIGNAWEKLSEEVQKNVENTINRVLEEKMELQRTMGTFHKLLLPKIHGAFPSHKDRLAHRDMVMKRGVQMNMESENVGAWIVRQRVERLASTVFDAKTGISYDSAISGLGLNDSPLRHQTALRRLDLTITDLKMCFDCSDKEQERPVQFKIPKFDIGSIDFSLLKDRNFVRFLQINLKKLEHSGRYDSLNSWNNPKYDRVEVDRNLLLQLYKKQKIEHPSQINQDFISKLFTVPVHLDTFQQFLDMEMDKHIFITEDGKELEITTYREVIEAAMSSSHSHFTHMLSLLESCKSVLVHAMVAEFVIEYFKNIGAKSIISNLITKRDIETLYQVAKAVTFYDEVPTNVFRYTEEVQQFVHDLISPITHEQIVKHLMVLYYLDCIAISLGAIEQEEKYAFIYPLLIERMESLMSEMAKYLHEDSCTFLEKDLWFCLGHRNSKISHLGHFMLELLLSVSDCSDSICHLLMSDEIDLVSKTRTLASSRFTHVRRAITHLMPIFEREKWKRLLMITYSNPDNIVDDLVKIAQRVEPDSTPPLITSIAFNFLAGMLDIKKQRKLKQEQQQTGVIQESLIEIMQLVNAMLESGLFGKLINEVNTANHQKRVNRGSVMASMLLARFTKFLTCNDLLRTHSAKPALSKTSSVSWKGFSKMLKGNMLKKRTTSNATGVGSVRPTKSSPPLSPLSASVSSESPSMSPMGSPRMPPSSFEEGSSLSRTSSFGNDGELKLEVTQENVMHILDFVSSNATKQRTSYRARIYMLKCLRHLLKNSEIFEQFVCKKNDSFVQQHFYNRLLEMCKDGNDMTFNRNAWHLFYQVIKFHTGVIEQLLKLNLLGSFLELIGQTSNTAGVDGGGGSTLQLSSSVVMTNAFHYLDKIFNLPENSIPRENRTALGHNANEELDDDQDEEPHLLRTGNNVPSDDTVKQYDKAIARFSDFIIQKHMYTHWFTAYARLQEDYNGWPFHCLAKLFATLHNHSSCSRLLTHLKKNKEYREALHSVVLAISGEDETEI